MFSMHLFSFLLLICSELFLAGRAFPVSNVLNFRETRQELQILPLHERNKNKKKTKMKIANTNTNHREQLLCTSRKNCKVFCFCWGWQGTWSHSLHISCSVNQLDSVHLCAALTLHKIITHRPMRTFPDCLRQLIGYARSSVACENV